MQPSSEEGSMLAAWDNIDAGDEETGLLSNLQGNDAEPSKWLQEMLQPSMQPSSEEGSMLAAWDNIDAGDEETGLLRQANRQPAEVVRWWRDKNVSSLCSWLARGAQLCHAA